MANKKFDVVRNEIMGKFEQVLSKDDYDVLYTNSNELCIPIVNSDGEESYLVMTFKVPTGSRDGDVYDGYSVAEEYRMKCETRKEKAEKMAILKEQKIARDKKMREEKARLKAEREGKKEG